MTVTFAALANAMTSQAGALGSLAGAGLSLSKASNDEVKATLNLVITSGTAVWRVTRTDHNEISIQLVSSSGLTSSLLNGIGNIRVPLPSLPMGLSIQCDQRHAVRPGGHRHRPERELRELASPRAAGTGSAPGPAGPAPDRSGRDGAGWRRIWGRSGRGRGQREAPDDHRGRGHGAHDRLLRGTVRHGRDGAGEDAGR